MIEWVALGHLWKGYVNGTYTYQIARYRVPPAKIVLYHEGPEYSVSLGSFKTIRGAKAAAARHAAQAKNPISTTRNVLLGVAALGALSVIAYAMSGSSASATGGSAGSSAATGGSANFGPGIGPGGKIKPG